MLGVASACAWLRAPPRGASAFGLATFAEGMGSRGKNRPARYHTALGSLREVVACFDVSAALGYTPELAPEVRQQFHAVLGVLFVLSR